MKFKIGDLVGPWADGTYVENRLGVIVDVFMSPSQYGSHEVQYDVKWAGFAQLGRWGENELALVSVGKQTNETNQIKD